MTSMTNKKKLSIKLIADLRKYKCKGAESLSYVVKPKDIKDFLRLLVELNYSFALEVPSKNEPNYKMIIYYQEFYGPESRRSQQNIDKYYMLNIIDDLKKRLITL